MLHAIYPNIRKIFTKQYIILANEKNSLAILQSKVRGFNKVLLITGKKSYESSGSKELIDKVLKNSQITIFNAFNVNPDVSEIRNGFEIAKKIKPDSIIAIRGGSVIDAAKIIHAMFSSNLDHKKILEATQKELYKVVKQIPLIAIPTTAGTGSESTHFAVLYKDQKKYSVASPNMLPSIVYLDSKLCISNSSYQNACSGFDALAQAIESYWSKNSNFISKYYAKKSLKIILEHFKDTINSEKKEVYHLSKMLQASNYAGKAINITKTTGPHAISYGITKNLNLPHGHAVAITLGAFFKFHNKIFDNNNHELRSFKIISDFIIEKTNQDASSFLYNLMERFDMEYDLISLGLNDNKIDGLVNNVNLERLSNHPVKLDANQLKEIFDLIPKKN